MALDELSVWGIHEEKQYPCKMKEKDTSNKTDSLICEIETDIEFQQIQV